MVINWPNGSLIIGRLLWIDAFGISLSYGNRILVGETVPYEETIFVYTHTFYWCTWRDRAIAGSIPRAVMRRLGLRIYRWATRPLH